MKLKAKIKMKVKIKKFCFSQLKMDNPVTDFLFLNSQQNRFNLLHVWQGSVFFIMGINF